VFYVPLVMRLLNGTSSQIMVQNASTSPVNVTIELTKAAASGGSNYTKSGVTIQAGATYYYDLSDESSANVANAWYGSAVVTATGGQITVISNLFAGADQLQTFNGFMPTDLGNKWFIPLFASRLVNKLSTPVTVQNLSGASIAAGGLTLNCTKEPGTTGSDTIAVSNSTAVADKESYFFNPVDDTTNLPTDWYGSCVLNSTGNVAVFVQMRQPGANVNAAAYEAINANGTNQTVLIPLIAKILSNGFATPVTIQNLGNTATTVNITYTPGAGCTPSCQTYTENGVSIPANGSLNRNFRLPGTFAQMPSNWFGTMKVVSSSTPIDGFVQLTTIGAPNGDTLMAHGVFTLP